MAQFRAELLKLCTQRDAWLGFAACLAVEIRFAIFFKIPAVRAVATPDFQRAHVDFQQAFSGLTAAAHLLGPTAMTTGAFFMALIGGSMDASELEGGTLGMILSRPVSHHGGWVQNRVAAVTYSLLLTGFIAITSLAVGLAFEGRGRSLA